MNTSSGVSVDPAAASAVFLVVAVVYLAIFILALAGMWRVFSKAGQPGWAVIVPFYNLFVMLQVAHKPAWWLLLMLIPFVNIIIMILVAVALAENFGKGAGFAVGLVFLPMIFYPILGFGSAQYRVAPPPLR